MTLCSKLKNNPVISRSHWMKFALETCEEAGRMLGVGPSFADMEIRESGYLNYRAAPVLCRVNTRGTLAYRSHECYEYIFLFRGCWN